MIAIKPVIANSRIREIHIAKRNIVFVILNGLVYPFGHAHVSKKKFDGGNIRYDIWYARKIKYFLSKGNLYTRLYKKR